MNLFFHLAEDRAAEGPVNRHGRVRNPLLLLLAVAIGMTVAPARAQEAEQYNGRIVRKIEFLGLVRLTPDGVKARMKLKEGQAFSAEIMQGDIKKLVEDKLFFNIPSIRVRPTDDGVTISVIGEENKRVLEVSFFGLIEGKREELTTQIKTVAGGLVDQFTLDVDRQAIIDWYRLKGFHYVEVTAEKDTLEGIDGLVIVFKITEGPEVEIEKVTFEGNHSFADEELLKAMPKLSESGLFKDAPFVLDEVQRDVVQLTRFYRQQGFLDAEVALLGWEPKPDFSEVTVRITIKEGEPYRVRSIAIEGMTLFDPTEVIAGMDTKVGGKYRPGVELSRDIRKLLDRYKELAFIECDIRESGASIIDLEKNEVDVILRISEGEKIYTGEVEIRGNLETKDNVIRREIEVFTGEPLNEKKFDRSKQRILNLQYWEQAQAGSTGEFDEITNARFSTYREAYVTLRDTKRENVKDLIFSVKERDTGSIRFAVGVGSNNGLIGDITYEKDNFDPTDFPESVGDFFDAFTGGGQRLTLSAQPGTQLSRFIGTYYNPRIFDTDFSFRQDGYLTFAFRENWRETRTGERTTIGRRLGDDMFVSVGMRNELVDVNHIRSGAPQLVFDFEGERLLSSVQLDWRLSRVDNFIDPTDGYILNASWEHAGLWGDIEFNQLLGGGEYYVPLHEDEQERWHVLRFKATMGWAEEFGDTHDIPVYERFFAGGANSLRGFQFRGIGPRDNGDPIGGKALWLASAEYSFPLIGVNKPGEPSLRGVTFLDTGSVALDWSDSAIADVRVSVGFGIRVVIPFLGSRPIAFDFGFPLVSQDGDHERVLSFSFGSNF